MDLVDNVTRFEEFKLTPEYERQRYRSKLISKWVPSTPYNLQSDILAVYYKALAYSTIIEVTSFGNLTSIITINPDPKCILDPGWIIKKGYLFF